MVVMRVILWYKETPESFVSSMYSLRIFKVCLIERRRENEMSADFYYYDLLED